jgi:hypothetical protein
MSLVTLAIVNGILVAELVAALAYICSIPFRIDRVKPGPRARVAELRAPHGDFVYERSAA